MNLDAVVVHLHVHYHPYPFIRSYVYLFCFCPPRDTNIQPPKKKNTKPVV